MSYTAPVDVNHITDLANLDVTGFPVGQKAYTIVDGPGYWTLTVSTASVDHTTVEAVKGFANLRWLIDASTVVTSVVAGTGISVDSTAPAAPVVASTLAVGKAGGQTVIGGTAASENLTLKSTTNATKGKVILGAAGTSFYDEVNDLVQSGTQQLGFSSGGVRYLRDSSAVLRHAADQYDWRNSNGATSHMFFGLGTVGLEIVADRFQTASGANAASAAPLVLGQGNVFHVTGTTNFAGIVTTNWQSGAQVCLIFDGILTVTHNSGTPGASAAAVFFKSGSNLTTAANTTLRLAFDGTLWYEV